MLPRLALLAAFPRHPHARQLLIACGLAAGIVFAAGTAALIVSTRYNDINDSGRELKNLAFMLSEEVDRVFQTAELVSAGVSRLMMIGKVDTPEKFATAMGSYAAHEALVYRIEQVPHISSLALFDRHGKLVNVSRTWPTPDIDVTDRDFFRPLAEDTTRSCFVSEPTMRHTDKVWTILLSCPYRGPDGQLIGIINVGMNMDYFEEFFSHIALSDDATTVLFRNDGVMLARRPHMEPSIGKKFGTGGEFDSLLRARDGGVLRRAGLVDNRERQVAPHSTAHYPLLVTVTNTMDAILADWRMRSRWIIAATALVELILGGIVVLGVRRLRDQERLVAAHTAALEAETGRTVAEAQLEVAREREQRERESRRQSLHFDTAVGNMLQGLLMCDNVGRVLVANNRFRELWDLPEDLDTKNMNYNELSAAAVRRGNIPENDMATLRTWRSGLSGIDPGAVFTWELADGRAFTVTHQTMEDGWLTAYEDVTDRRKSEAKIAHMAHHDALTDLPNRVLFRQRLDRALAHARRGQMMAVLFLDLDQFKAVNDTLGHPIGDDLLKAVAKRLTERARETDTVARLGGDEFAIIQTAIESPADAIALATRLITILQTPFEIAGHRIVIGTSVGIAFAPQDGLDPDVLLKNADLALYRAKADGRGVCRLFQTAMDAEMQARRILELDLRQALPCGQLELYYQPLVDLNTRSVSGFEALLRWHHPEKGMIPPDRFIHLAEEIGAIIPIGEWVMRQACATALSWPAGMKVSVNLSPIQFKSRNLVQMVADALSESGLPPDQLELEITETVMLQDTETTLATLHALHALGVRIAMDDFGTGYSSLSYLRRFPFDRIKIDQSFIREMSREEDCGAIIRAVIGLSQELGISTTAEGVETAEQLVALATAGCSDIQGFLFSRPVQASEIRDLLRSMPTVDELIRGSETSVLALAAAEV